MRQREGGGGEEERRHEEEEREHGGEMEKDAEREGKDVRTGKSEEWRKKTRKSRREGSREAHAE